MGVPTVVMGMPGARDDRAHQLALPAGGRDHRAVAGLGAVFEGGAPWQAKTHAVGAISRFDGPPPRRSAAAVSRGCSSSPGGVAPS